MRDETEKMIEVLVATIRPWQKDGRIVGYHTGDGRLGCAPPEHIHLHAVTSFCGGQLKYQPAPGPPLYPKGYLRCSKCLQMLALDMREPDVISQWCWSTVLTWMWQANPDAYRSMRQDEQYHRLTAPALPLWLNGTCVHALEFKDWLGSEKIVKITGLAVDGSGSVAESMMQAFASLTAVAKARFHEVQVLAGRSYSSLAWTQIC